MGVFDTQLAIVTGASRGLGRDIALELAREGATVACIATRIENAASTVAAIEAAGGRARAYGCRVERADEVTATFAAIGAEMGAPRLLVNNAGISDPVPTLDMSEDNWDRQMDINAKSVFLCAQAAARLMKDAGGGAIVNIGSILGRNAFPGTLAYCVSKAAVDQMTKVLAIEWARYQIRVNCVAPGYVQTEMIDELEASGKLKIRDLERRTPMRRLGTGHEVARAVVYMGSSESSWVTGETLVLDGGWTAYGFYQGSKS